MDSAVLCKIPKCCLLIAQCCRHQGGRDAVRTNIMYRQRIFFFIYSPFSSSTCRDHEFVWVAIHNESQHDDLSF